jgi:hypothetical protein
MFTWNPNVVSCLFMWQMYQTALEYRVGFSKIKGALQKKQDGFGSPSRTA